jgi:phosphate transport system substrate-binding protein
MKKILVFLLVLIISNCTQKSNNVSSLKGELRIAGGTAHLKVMKTVAEKLMKENPDLKISVAGGGSGVGIKQVGEGIIDIGNSGRAVKKSEIEKYNLKPVPFAIDGIGIIINPKNPVNNLSTETAKKIFSGEIYNWKQVNGPDKKINVYTRDKESGTRKTFVKLLLGKNIQMTKSANFVKSNGAMKIAVSNDPYSIGYVSVGHIDNTVKPLSINSIKPTIENIKSGKYSVKRYLYMITKGEPNKLSEIFINTILSDYGQNVVKENHFIPVK